MRKTMPHLNSTPHGQGLLALEYCGKRLPLQVLQSAAGFYIGTMDDDGPCSRESVSISGTTCWRSPPCNGTPGRRS